MWKITLSWWTDPRTQRSRYHEAGNCHVNAGPSSRSSQDSAADLASRVRFGRVTVRNNFRTTFWDLESSSSVLGRSGQNGRPHTPGIPGAGNLAGQGDQLVDTCLEQCAVRGDVVGLFLVLRTLADRESLLEASPGVGDAQGLEE